MVHLNRRRFLKTSLAAGTTFAISGTKSSGNILGSNERIRVAVAGVHGRGRSHISGLAKMKDVQVTYLIDPDSREFDRAVKSVTNIAGNTPKTVQDVRTALEDSNLDAVSIATPNHWHALMTIWACQAGKDVYVEKPSSHNVHEGRIAVEAARKYKRIVQHGTQTRSSDGMARTIAAVKSGKFGKLLVSRGYCFKRRRSIGTKPLMKSAPDGLDFNVWLGPAPKQPYHGNLVHYNWHWFWDTGNGDIGNQGVHQMDIARWAIDGATLPKSVISVGGRFGYTDQGQTANTQLAIFDYGETQLTFEVRGLNCPRKVGNSFVMEEGVIANGQFFPKGGKKAESLPNVKFSLGPGSGHFGNFIAAVKSRNSKDLNADVLEGHYSSALCHLPNISLRLGEQVPFNKKTQTFRGNPVASEAFASMEEHLSKENGVKLEQTTYHLGRLLKIDAKSETFMGDKDANSMLTRNYRKPFVVPEKIV